MYHTFLSYSPDQRSSSLPPNFPYPGIPWTPGRSPHPAQPLLLPHGPQEPYQWTPESLLLPIQPLPASDLPIVNITSHNPLP